MNSKLYAIARKVNIARPVCEWLLGESHAHWHRMVVGVFVMAIGVCIAKYFGHHDNAVVAYVGDGIGYGVHGLGLTPFIEYLVLKFATEV